MARRGKTSVVWAYAPNEEAKTAALKLLFAQRPVRSGRSPAVRNTDAGQATDR